VKKLLIVACGTMLALALRAETNAPAPAAAPGTNTVAAKKPAARAKIDPNDPVEKEYSKILEDDDSAQAEVDRWLRDNEKFAADGAGVPEQEMKRRIQKT
jgi:hypothetical protein